MYCGCLTNRCIDTQAEFSRYSLFPRPTPLLKRKALCFEILRSGQLCHALSTIANYRYHITAASRILNHCSFSVKDGWSREAANSVCGRMGDATFSLAVSPVLPFSLQVTFGSLGDAWAWRVAIIMCLSLSDCLCSRSYVVSCNIETLQPFIRCLYSLLLYWRKGR